MNEKTKKTIVGLCFIGLVLCILLQSIVYNTNARRNDRELDTYKRELYATRAELERVRREVEDCRGTISECRDTVGNIRTGLAEDNAGLAGVIGQLKTIREEVKVLEDTLSSYYYRYGDINNDTFDTEVTQ